MYFYMIRKIGTNRYYTGGGHWYSQSIGLIWWNDDTLPVKSLKRLQKHWACELVKFKYEELP